MKKGIVYVAIVILVAVIIGAVVFFVNSNNGTVVEMATEENLAQLVSQVNKNANLGLSLETNIVDVTDEETVKVFTGLSSNANVESLVVSEPMMSSQAYSFVLVKVSEDADIETMKKEMLDNINMRKWICVEAEKVYVTNHSNLICLVMASEEWANPVYNAFKEVVQNKIGEELERSAEVWELPDEMLEFENDGVPVEQQPAF